MVKIVLCDDEQTILSEMKNIIKEKCVQSDFECEIETFTDGRELIEKMNTGHEYFAVFIDIDMPDMSGIDVVRNMPANDKAPIIVFVSNHEDMVFDAIKLRPARFVRKRLIKSELEEAVVYLISEHKKSEGRITLHSGKAVYEVKCGEICYVETSGHYLRVVLLENEFKIRGKLSEYINKLCACDFVQIQKGIAVNMKFVEKMNKDMVLMKNGASFTISRTNRNDVKKEFLRYMRREM